MKKMYVCMYLSIATSTALQASSTPNAYDGTEEGPSGIRGHEEWIDQTQRSSYHDSGHVIMIQSTQLIKALVEKIMI